MVLSSSDFETCDAGTFISDYHFPMVADDVRNNMFYKALKKAIVPNVSRVIDVGAGTMLLSMMSIDLGAASVLGVEENKHMAAVARDVLRINNYTSNTKKGKIRLYEGSFESLYMGHKQVLHCSCIMSTVVMLVVTHFVVEKTCHCLRIGNV